jgi:hypothetical protein
MKLIEMFVVTITHDVWIWLNYMMFRPNFQLHVLLYGTNLQEVQAYLCLILLMFAQ